MVDVVSLEQLRIAIINARREERERCIRALKYYGVTLRWSLTEIVTKLQEGLEPEPEPNGD